VRNCPGPSLAFLATFGVAAAAAAQSGNIEPVPMREALSPEPDCKSSLSGAIDRAEPHMGTIVRLRILVTDDGPECAALDDAMGRAFLEIARLERLLSEWKPGTELTAVNNAAGEAPVVVSAEVLDLVMRSLHFAELTDGAFDPTFAALWGLWTFGEDGVNRPPDAAELEQRRRLVDWRKVRVDRDKSTIFLPEPGMKIGLGGIAKGYAADRVAEVLRAAGVDNYVLHLGGETVIRDVSWDGDVRAGIRDPRGPGTFAFFTWQGAVNTSGDYERFFRHEGVRYHHIIDPATARPARKTRSATVLSGSATDADALATALFVLGPERGLALIERLPDTEAVVVGADNRVWLSSGVPADLQLSAPTDAP
jgi:thiamine biosynthesis lipoprotein